MGFCINQNNILSNYQGREECINDTYRISFRREKKSVCRHILPDDWKGKYALEKMVKFISFITCK